MYDILDHFELRFNENGVWYGITVREALETGRVNEVKQWLYGHFLKANDLFNGKPLTHQKIRDILSVIQKDGYVIPRSRIKRGDFHIRIK